MTSATHSHMFAGLAFEQAEQFESSQQWRRRAKPLLLSLLHVPLAIVGSWVARRIDRVDSRLVRTQAIFRGVRASIEEDQSYENIIDPNGKLVEILAHMASDLETMSANCGDFAQQREKADGFRNGPVRDAFRRLGATAASLRDEVVGLRASVLKYDEGVRAMYDVGSQLAKLRSDADRMIASLHSSDEADIDQDLLSLATESLRSAQRVTPHATSR